MSWLAYCSGVNPSRFARASWVRLNLTLRGFAPLFLEEGATTTEGLREVEEDGTSEPLSPSPK